MSRIRATIFSPQGGQRGDAHVDFLLLAVVEAEAHLDPAVLGEALLGDVHVRQDLDAGDDRAAVFQRQADDLVEVAVHPVADTEARLVRLEVDVARAPLDGVDKGLVDELDDRGFIGPLLLVEEAAFCLVLDDVDPAVVGQGDVLDDLLDPDGVGRPVVLVDGVDDARLRGDDGLDGEPRTEADVLDDLEVGRIDHGQGQE